MSTYVIAIGGNALESNTGELNTVLKEIANCIADLISKDNRVVLVHGNGPQIGKIVIQNHCAHGIIEENTIDECGAMTQAMIGYTLQKELGNSLRTQGITADIVTVLTQVIVDKAEVLTSEPTKPIGPFYSKAEAMERMEKEGVPYAEDSNRGYRRVIASPKPLRIEEIDVIRQLITAGSIVIAGGGGGIPVYEENGELKGIEAVIDKDYTAELLAKEIDADCLILLTAVEYVAINYGKENQQNLESVTCEEIERYTRAGQFSKGSMLPKVLAAKGFVEGSMHRSAVIGTLDKLKEIVNGNSGTKIINA